MASVLQHCYCSLDLGRDIQRWSVNFRSHFLGNCLIIRQCYIHKEILISPVYPTLYKFFYAFKDLRYDDWNSNIMTNSTSMTWVTKYGNNWGKHIISTKPGICLNSPYLWITHLFPMLTDSPSLQPGWRDPQHSVEGTKVKGFHWIPLLDSAQEQQCHGTPLRGDWLC